MHPHGLTGYLTTQVPPNASVVFDLELIDWNTLTDRYLDGSVVIKSFGQPDDYFASACRDSAKVFSLSLSLKVQKNAPAAAANTVSVMQMQESWGMREQ